MDTDVANAFRHVHQLSELGASALQLQTSWRETTLLLFQRYARLGSLAKPGKEPFAIRQAQELLLTRLTNTNRDEDLPQPTR